MVMAQQQPPFSPVSFALRASTTSLAGSSSGPFHWRMHFVSDKAFMGRATEEDIWHMELDHECQWRDGLPLFSRCLTSSLMIFVIFVLV
jgi:hypothetical protein